MEPALGVTSINTKRLPERSVLRRSCRRAVPKTDSGNTTGVGVGEVFVTKGFGDSCLDNFCVIWSMWSQPHNQWMVSSVRLNGRCSETVADGAPCSPCLLLLQVVVLGIVPLVTI